MTAAHPDPGPAYLAGALARRAEGPLDSAWREDPSVVTLSAAGQDLALSCQVDPRSHKVLRVRHSGAASDAQRGLMNALASTMVGHSIQDASEHALIRLENLLRDRAAPSRVAGILQPENADPAFLPLLALVRGLFAQYRTRTGYASRMNVEDAPAATPSSEWGTSPLPERIQKLLAAVPEICPQTGILKSDIVIRRIDLEHKVTVQVRHDDAQAQQRYLARLELDLRARVDPRIELYLEPRKDANTKRREKG